MSRSAYYYPNPTSLRRTVKYDRSTGTFYYIKTKRPLNFVFFNGEQYLATQHGRIAAGDLAYVCVHGQWPDGPVLFVNGDAFDLRWANLYVDEPRHPGVYWYRRSHKWQGLFQYNKQQYHVGYFDDQEEAAQAVQEKKEALASSGN